MKKISALAFIAAFGLALPAYAQTPADEHSDVMSHEVHKENVEQPAEHTEKKKEMAKEHKKEEHAHTHHHHHKHEEAKKEKKEESKPADAGAAH